MAAAKSINLETVCIKLDLKSKRFEISISLEIFFVYMKYLTTVLHWKRKAQVELPQSER